MINVIWVQNDKGWGDYMHRRIGVIDTGIGGLSVMNGLQKLLPHEDIIYFGDSKNCPYGNRSEEEILGLTIEMLRFMEKRDVKLVAVACNTISALIDLYENKFNFPIIDIIRPTVEHIHRMEIFNIGIFATEFTIKSNIYANLLKEKNRDIKIVSEGSKYLAGLIDSGEFESQRLKDVINEHIENILNKGNIYNLVLACTHFSIVEQTFFDLAPQFNYINPGFQQARAVREYLYKNNLLNNNNSMGKLEIFTSGNKDIYERIINRIDIKNVQGIYEIKMVN